MIIDMCPYLNFIPGRHVLFHRHTKTLSNGRYHFVGKRIGFGFQRQMSKIFPIHERNLRTGFESKSVLWKPFKSHDTPVNRRFIKMTSRHRFFQIWKNKSDIHI